MDNVKQLVNTRGLLENYDKGEIDSLLWDMYKGWFLNRASEIDSDKMKDMLLFYGALKELLMNLSPSEKEPL